MRKSTRNPAPVSTSKFFRQELFQRMSDDLHLTGKAPRTHSGYLRAVRKLAEFCRKQPDQISKYQCDDDRTHASLLLDRLYHGPATQ